MKKLLLSIATALTLGAAWPAFAGPDFRVIEKARATGKRPWRRKRPPPESTAPPASG